MKIQTYDHRLNRKKHVISSTRLYLKLAISIIVFSSHVLPYTSFFSFIKYLNILELTGIQKPEYRGKFVERQTIRRRFHSLKTALPQLPSKTTSFGTVSRKRWKNRETRNDETFFARSLVSLENTGNGSHQNLAFV